MLVKDLIHLLNTRCQPDDEVVFTSFVQGKENSVFQIMGHSSDSFNAVFRESDPDENHAEAFIDIGDCFLHNFIVDLDKIDLQKFSKKKLDNDY